MMHHQQHQGIENPRTTNMVPSPDLNRAVSPSWNSAMTQMQMQGLEQFYRVTQGAHLARQQAQESQHQHPHSPSSIEPHVSLAQNYSQELHRQQQEQMRNQQQAMEARRHSEEAEYIQSLVATFQQQQHPHHYFQLSEDSTHRHQYQMHHQVQDHQQPLHSPLEQGGYHPQMHQEHFPFDEEGQSPTSLLHSPPLLLE